MATLKPIYNPGVKNAPSGVYDTVGPRGGVRPNSEVTHTKGEPLPPTKISGQHYVLQEAAKHHKR